MMNWDFKYCELAKHIAQWSKDPSRKIGAVVVGQHGQILSQGYNGFPRGVDDTIERLNDREQKYKYIVHAEMNCIYNASLNGVSLNESTLYAYGLPICSDCSKGIIQVGITRVVVYTPEVNKSDIPDKWKQSGNLAKDMFKEAKIKYDWYDKIWIK